MGRRGLTGTSGRKAGLALLLILLIPLAASPAIAADGSAALTISGTILPPNDLAVDFAGAPRTGTAPLTVRFTDHSTGNPMAWAWELDDDGFVDSNAKDPSFVYHQAGRYTVTLTVSNTAGTDSETKPGYITVLEPGAPARVRSLQMFVAAMPADGWVKWLLSIHLEIAEMRIRRGNERAAASQMQVFINRVNLFERLRLMTAGDAAYMREETQIIRELLKE